MAPTRTIAVLLIAASCRSSEATDAGAPASQAALPAAWTLGAVGVQAVAALPPPCVLRDDALRAYLARDTRLLAARGVLGTVLVAEGAVDGAAFRHDASGLFAMGHGATLVQAAPWPGSARPAHDGTRWLVPIAAEGELAIWRDGAVEKLGARAEPVDARCGGGRCAVLGAGVLFAGDAGTSSAPWSRTELPDKARALAIAALDGQSVTVAVADATRVRFWRIDPAGRTEIAAVHGGAGALDAIARPRPIGLVVEAQPGSCDAEAGGVTLAGAGRGAVRLRSATPAAAGAFVELQRTTLVLWQAPASCDGGREMLYGATLGEDGGPLAPVTAIGDAESWAASARGDDVDLWIRQDRTVTYLPLRCGS
jgi:hypothetical protein